MIKSGENIFDSGVAWRVFNEVETELVSFFSIVPLVPKHEDVFSFKLFNLILSIGSHVDNVFKAMSRYNKFNNNQNMINIINADTPNIGMYRNAFEPIYHLSSKKIFVKKDAIIPLRDYYSEIIPFSGFTKKSPKWWKIYNELKHSWFKGNNIYEANVNNAIRSLAALFILNIRHEESWDKLVDLGVIKAGNFNEGIEHGIKNEVKFSFLKLKGLNLTPQVAPFVEIWAESKLFIYRFPFWQKWLIRRNIIKNMKPKLYQQFYSPLKF